MPDEINTEDLLKQIEQTLNPDSAPKSETVKFGDKEVSLGDSTAVKSIVEEFNKYRENTERELSQLKAQPKYVPVEQDSRPGPTPVPQPQFTPLSPNWALEEYAKELQKDPVAAHDQALARALGLAPGIKAANVIHGLVAGLQTLAQQNQASQQRVNDLIEEYEAQMFLQSHQDYTPSPENMEVLESYREAHRLPLTAKNLHLAYLEAVNDGALKVKEVEETPVVRQERQTVGVPSLRGTANERSSDNGMSNLYEQLSKLPSGQDQLNALHGLFDKGVFGKS